MYLECDEITEFPLWYGRLWVWGGHSSGVGYNCDLDWTPGLGTSICCGYGKKKKKKKKKRRKKVGERIEGRKRTHKEARIS